MPCRQSRDGADRPTVYEQSSNSPASHHLHKHKLSCSMCQQSRDGTDRPTVYGSSSVKSESSFHQDAQCPVDKVETGLIDLQCMSGHSFPASQRLHKQLSSSIVPTYMAIASSVKSESSFHQDAQCPVDKVETGLIDLQCMSGLAAFPASQRLHKQLSPRLYQRTWR